MSTIILGLALAAMVSLGFLAVFAVLLIGMRTEGGQLSPTSAPHTRTESMARRLTGLYVRRELQNVSARPDARR
jgi:hypothetical protein